MRRGALVNVALQGDLGKPRPALVVQSNLFDEHASVMVLPITSLQVDAPLLRIVLEPDGANGLKLRSHVMVDKPQSIARSRLGPVIGRADDETLLAVNRALAVFMGPA